MCVLCSAAERRLCVCVQHLRVGRTQAVLFKECTASSLGNHFPWRREKETRFWPGLHSSPPPRLRLSAGSLSFSTRGGQSNRTLNTHAMTPSRVRWAVPESCGAFLIGMINIVVIGDTFLNGSSLSPGRTLRLWAKAKSTTSLSPADKVRTFYCADKRAPWPSVIAPTCSSALTLCWWAGLSSGHSSLVDCDSILRSCWPRCLVLHCRLPFGFSGSPCQRKRDGKVPSRSREGEKDSSDLRCSFNRCRFSERWDGIEEENFRMVSAQKPSERTGTAREKEKEKD